MELGSTSNDRIGRKPAKRWTEREARKGVLTQDVMKLVLGSR